MSEASRPTTRGSPARWLRRPRVITAELAVIALAGAAAATLPQEPDGGAIAGFQARWPVLSRVTAGLGLHEVTASPWFFGAVLLALLSLLLVQRDQWRRALREREGPLDAARLSGAQYRRELDLAGDPAPKGAFKTTGRAGRFGSPLFHLGLVMLLSAGLWRALTFGEAVVRSFEGATLAAGAEAWEFQRSGPLGAPFAVAHPVRLVEVRPAWYPSGELLELEARVSVHGEDASLAVNRPLEVGAERIYLTQTWGVAALVEVRSATGVERGIAYLEESGRLARGAVPLPGGLEARFKARLGEGRPDRVEVRLARGSSLVAIAELGVGGELEVGDSAMRLAALPYWAQYRGSRDRSEPLFLGGLAVAVLGIVVAVSLVRVDRGVFVEGDKLVVVLRAQRFAPLFAEEFERMCRERRP